MDAILQVWSIIWISLVSFSIATATVVTVSFDSLTFLRCLGREESFRLLLDIDIKTLTFFKFVKQISQHVQKKANLFCFNINIIYIFPPSGTV